MTPKELSGINVESCPYRLPAPGLALADGTARCGLIAGIFGIGDDSSSLVTRETCECCCRSFPPSPRNPNPVVSSLLYARGLALAAKASTAAEAARLRTITERARQGLDVVYAEPPPGRPNGVPARSSLAEMLPLPTSRSGGRVRDWAVGVTTSPRIQPTLERTLESLLRAGWERPWLFIDSAVQIPAPFSHLPFTYRFEKIGAWPSYYLALMELLLRHPHADAYMVIQDDALMCAGGSPRAYLESVLWPGRAPSLVSLYCGEPDTAPEPGWHPCDGVASSGPVALVFPPELAREFVGDPAVLEHRWLANECAATSIGDLVAVWAHGKGVQIWLPTPSLVQHIGETSTLWPMTRAAGSRRASQFADDVPPDQS